MNPSEVMTALARITWKISSNDSETKKYIYKWKYQGGHFVKQMNV